MKSVGESISKIASKKSEGDVVSQCLSERVHVSDNLPNHLKSVSSQYSYYFEMGS